MLHEVPCDAKIKTRRAIRDKREENALLGLGLSSAWGGRKNTEKWRCFYVMKGCRGLKKRYLQWHMRCFRCQHSDRKHMKTNENTRM